MPKRAARAHFLKKGERFALIPEKVARSEAFLSLSGSAVKLIVLAATKYSGHNNGEIALTRNGLKEKGFASQATLTRAINQLLEHGLLVKTRQGGLGQGGKLPNLFALGWVDIPSNPKLDIRTPCAAKDGWKSFSSCREKRLPPKRIK